MEAQIADLQAEVKRLHDKLQKVEGGTFCDGLGYNQKQKH